jgi:type III restriction enzyme
MSELKLKFDATLDFQQEAIASVVGLFDGMPLAEASFALTSGSSTQLGFSELGVANPEPGDPGAFEAAILANLRDVQERSGIARSDMLDGMNFSVEMETGTGKTYVYLRMICELHKVYGFKKFVIVVPSIAIREGVLASIGLLRDHLRSLYDNAPFDAAVYDSKHLGRVRQFAAADTLQILVMNLQAFQKDVEEEGDPTKANVINRAQDRMSGRRPIEFIQATHPVVVMDEPQNMESEAAAAAIARLNPFCTLRYSATHKRRYNLTYRLGPIDAYDLNLVKRIEVASVVADENPNAAFVRLHAVDAAKARAHVTINHGVGSAFKTKKIWVNVGDDLAVLSGDRQEYATGWIVSDISFRPGAEVIEFTNGSEVSPTVASASFDEDVRRAQVVETVRQHLDKERTLASLGIKVLSLFFVDKVANYRAVDDSGNPALGPIGRWFEEAYEELSQKPRYAALSLPSVADVHGGYFSVDNKQRPKDTRGDSAVDVDTYDLIMRDRERLLSLDEPLRFIFSHSALREGWDNPNVFQICTLNESKSTDRKRQEIGRGLRLPVDQSGERVHDPLINRLTIVANEAYDQFARELQTEYEDDTGVRFGIVPKQAFAKLIHPAPPPGEGAEPLGQDVSSGIWEHLRVEGYLAESGAVLPKFNPTTEGFELNVPAEMRALRAEITDVVSRFVFANRIVNAKRRQTVRFRKHVTLDPGFQELWQRVSKRTKYRVSLSSEELIEGAARAIAEADSIEPPKIRVRVVELEHSAAGIGTDKRVDQHDYSTAAPTALPDILANLQNETDLTRATLVEVLRRSGRLGDFLVNPQAFTVMVTAKINNVMHRQMVDGIRYEPIPGLHWEMRRLEPEVSEELERYAARLYKVQSADKTLYDHVEIESEVERRFAKGLDNNNNVKFFMKLPVWFTVDTPIGPYNPDWAIVFDGSERVYLVRETKGSADPDELRGREETKIRCAQQHFDAIDVDYAVTSGVEEMVSALGLPTGPSKTRR